jgi:hypothetical protein
VVLVRATKVGYGLDEICSAKSDNQALKGRVSRSLRISFADLNCFYFSVYFVGNCGFCKGELGLFLQQTGSTNTHLRNRKSANITSGKVYSLEKRMLKANYLKLLFEIDTIWNQKKKKQAIIRSPFPPISQKLNSNPMLP